MQPDPNDELLRLTFYASPPHQCSYLENQSATTVFLDPEKEINPRLYSKLSDNGFRRSGSHIYKPHCQFCQACIPVRIVVNHFKPSKSQRRCIKKAKHFRYELEKAHFSEVHYQLYENYICQRHADGDMYPPTPQQYKDFLLCDWSNTFFLSLYDGDRLISCSVIDFLNNAISAVYTYFDTDYEPFSPGRLAILTMTSLAKEQNLPFVYLGYLIKSCDKMRYKSEYRPLDCLIDNQWIRLN